METDPGESTDYIDFPKDKPFVNNPPAGELRFRHDLQSPVPVSQLDPNFSRHWGEVGAAVTIYRSIRIVGAIVTWACPVCEAIEIVIEQ